MKDSAFRSAAYEDFTQHPDPEPEWPDPLVLDSELPPVKPLRPELLPDPIRDSTLDIAERMQVPADYPAVTLLLCLAGVTGRRAQIQPKAHDARWQVTPNLWGGLVAPPGLLKSPVINESIRPLHGIEADWRDEHEAALIDYQNRLEEHDLRHAAWRDKFKASQKSASAPVPERPAGEPPREPALRRLVANDGTFEALHAIMANNPAGLLVIRDELSGWLSQLDRQGREGERAFYLSAWNGDTGHTLDRIGRGRIHVPAVCLSILGGIQPARLRSYLTEAIRGGPGDDGLMQRLQVLVWPDTAESWTYVDRASDHDAENQLSRIFERITTLNPERPLRFRFGPEAQSLFIEWLGELERNVRTDQEHPAFTSHLSKYRSLMPSLALLFELADLATGGFVGFVGPQEGDFQKIRLSNARRAAAWCDYLESHARRIYSCVVSPELRAAQELARKIRQKKIGTDAAFTARQVYLKNWSGLDSLEVIRDAAELLIESYWLRTLDSGPGPAGGRPSFRYIVNPRVWQ